MRHCKSFVHISGGWWVDSVTLNWRQQSVECRQCWNWKCQITCKLDNSFMILPFTLLPSPSFLFLCFHLFIVFSSFFMPSFFFSSLFHFLLFLFLFSPYFAQQQQKTREGSWVGKAPTLPNTWLRYWDDQFMVDLATQIMYILELCIKFLHFLVIWPAVWVYACVTTLLWC